MVASSNLSLTVAHAVSFLTRPLIVSYPADVITRLQLSLEANLTALYAPTWLVKDPSHHSRSLSLSPHCLPPRPIYSASIAAGIQWFNWISLLGNQEFELFVSPGCVAIRYKQEPSDGKLFLVWSDQSTSPSAGAAKPRPGPIDVQTRSKTLAQQLLEDDLEVDDEVFAMIADEINAPTWKTPVDVRFSEASRPLSPVFYSRCSSRSSNSSSGSSYTSSQSSLTSLSSVSTSPSQGHKQFRRERTRPFRVFVDTSKNEVTPYDGGRTTVLTGGVMLGAAQSQRTKKPKTVGDW